jgi:hypothetical protein
MTPRFIERPALDPTGLRDPTVLPQPLPYNLVPRDFFRMVEDLCDLLHETNSMLVGKGYDRLEELMDPAGFSGLVSRAVSDGVAKFSRSLVLNRYHNGYPDLLPHGVYPEDSTAHGTRGGLEIKASRYEYGWQSHGPRSGWFCVVQFAIDRDENKALYDREPTNINCVLVAQLEEDDWSWQPAKPGRIRSGTASIKLRGEGKLRAGAVWVNPSYEKKHAARVKKAKLSEFSESATTAIIGSLQQAGAALTVEAICAAVAPPAGLAAGDVVSRVRSTLSSLVASGQVTRSARATYALV